MKKLWPIIFTISLIPVFVSAHVKWFAEAGTPVRPYLLTDWPVIVSMIAVFIIVLTGIFADRKISVAPRLKNLIEKIAPEILSIASIGFGLSFLIFSFSGFIFAPNLAVTASIGNGLLYLQVVAGGMILLGFYERVGGLLLIILFALGIKTFGFGAMIDALEMVGFAFYAMIIGRPKWKIIESKVLSHAVHKFHQYGVSILRVGTGVNLMILGFSEKILNPSMTANFLDKFNWNLMENFGAYWFTDYWFAYSAGMVEFLIGLFLLLGLLTRLTVLFLSLFLATTMYMLGPVELVGHLPHFSIACVLLIFGAGSRLHQNNKSTTSQ